MLAENESKPIRFQIRLAKSRKNEYWGETFSFHQNMCQWLGLHALPFTQWQMHVVETEQTFVVEIGLSSALGGFDIHR